MALRNIGADFEHHSCVEFDDFAMNSYNAIHGTDFKPTDICNVKGKDLLIEDRDKYCEIMVYSFPCTDISLAGQRLGMAKDSGTRSSLLWEVQRILEELDGLGTLPDVLLMENVTAIHGQDNLKHFQEWTGFLSGLGYKNYTFDLNTADFGLAQHRERTFVISLLGDYNYQPPTGMELTRCMEDFFEDLTEEEALKQVVKSDKAMKLLVELDEKGELD